MASANSEAVRLLDAYDGSEIDPSSAASAELDDTLQGHSPEFERKTVRKVDIRLLVVLGALYSICIIDRTNLSIARVAGMEKDLDLSVGDRYSIVALVFFIPYILCEIPCNLLLRKLGPRVVLSSISIGWGCAMCLMGLVTTWTQLAALRVVLGAFEAGFFPGCFFLIQTWYTRYETQKRIAAFSFVTTIISGFSGVFGYALSLLDGTLAIPGWRWIFLIEGVLTIVLAAISSTLIVDFPDKNTFLTAEETKLMLRRIALDRHDDVPDTMTLSKIIHHSLDWRTWAVGVCFTATVAPALALAYYLPILRGGGFSLAASLCLPAPAYILSSFTTMLISWSSDRNRLRGPYIVCTAVMAAIGLLILGYPEKIEVRFIGAFLLVLATQANVAALLAYSANNVRSHAKRAVSSAIVIGMGGVGGILAPLIFRQADAPRYLPGLWTTVGLQGVVIALVGCLTAHAYLCNRRAEEKGIAIEGAEGFRYTL